MTPSRKTSLLDLLLNLEWSNDREVCSEEEHTSSTLPSCPQCGQYKAVPDEIEVTDGYGGYAMVPVHPDEKDEVGHKDDCELHRHIRLLRGPPMPTPEDILNQIRRPTEWDGWVPTYTGAGYRPWDDNPGPLAVDDIAWGLAHTFRFGGQVEPCPTVAEHSLMVSNIIQALWPGDLANDEEYAKVVAAGLLHDAAEAVLHDIQAPLRSRVRVHLEGETISWNESDARVTRNIVKHFGIEQRHLEDPRVKAADILSACIEKRDCKNLDSNADWGLPDIPPEIARLRVCGYPPTFAFGMFREAMAFLLRVG